MDEDSDYEFEGDYDKAEEALINDFQIPSSEELENLDNHTLANYLINQAEPEELFACLQDQNSVSNTAAGRLALKELGDYIKGKKTTESLDDDEFNMIKLHAFSTNQILSQIEGLEEITQWAAQHHEKLNGRGYPYHEKKDNISMPARIISVADIFQALAQKRPYRDNLEPLEILNILHEKVSQEEIDANVVSIVEKNLQRCWEISLTNSH